MEEKHKVYHHNCPFLAPPRLLGGLPCHADAEFSAGKQPNGPCVEHLPTVDEVGQSDGKSADGHLSGVSCAGSPHGPASGFGESHAVDVSCLLWRQLDLGGLGSPLGRRRGVELWNRAVPFLCQCSRGGSDRVSCHAADPQTAWKRKE